MATFTITTGTPTARVNVDTLSGRTGGDTFAVNGGHLLIDEDARYGLNANTSAIYGPITPSATLGGSVLIDGRYIWLIPYTGGSGNVPAFNTTISKGGASGLLSGVYSALNVAPTTPGSAMPATGYIKVKQWNGTLYGTGALTGISATAAAGENVGWIVPVGQEGSVALISSLNQAPSGSYDGSFVKGDWFEVGTTSGSRATTYQVPTNGETVYHGGVMVDKAAATAISAATWSAGVATFTSTAHGLTTDDRVYVGGNISPRTWRTVDTQRCTVIDANTFTVPMTTNPGAYVSGGTVAAQEWWPVTDSVNTKVGATDYQGKHCWIDPATGLLRFGNDGTTSTGGVCPASGLVIRMPNVMSQMATSAAKTVNSLNATLGSRYRYYNGNAGTIRVDHLGGSWSPSVFQTGKYVQMSDCSVVNQISIATQASPCTVTSCVVGGNANTTAAPAFVVSSMSAGVTVTDSVISTGEMTARYPMNLASAYNVTVDRCRLTGTGDRTSATYSVNFNIGNTATFTRCKFGPHALATGSQFSNVSITDGSYYSSAYDLNPIAAPSYTISLSNLSANWTIDGITPYGLMPLARLGLLNAISGSDNTIVRNWGTYASPIDMRMNGYQAWKPWTRSGTTATVTENGHPYRAGDQVVVTNSTNTTTLTVTVKTITAVTANTFDIAAVNSGPTSGNVSYYVGNMLGFITLTGVNGAKVQNVHVRGNTANPFSTSSTQYGLTLENVSSDPYAYNLIPSFSANNLVARSVYETDYPILGLQTSVFGSHFTDVFVREPGTAVPGQAGAVTGVSWTRSGTTCTVTSPNHGIVGNIQRIWVENSSAPTPVPNGWGASGITLVPDDANTFHFTCVNSGATSGTLDYRLAGDSQFRVVMMEASPSTTAQAQITVNGGAAGFTGAGTLVLPAVGDQATWETPDFIRGYDSFGLTPAIPYGASLTSLANTQNFDIAYDLDRGSGFSGTWRNASLHKAGGGGSSASTTVTMTSTTGVQVGDYVYGIGIAAGAKVQSITNATDIVVTIANAAAVSGVLEFNYMPNETTFPSTGVKFRVRMTANTAQSAAAYQIDMPLLSSSTSRQRLYPQSTVTNQPVTISGGIAGTRIQIYDLTSGAELYNGTPTFPYTWTDSNLYVADRQIRLRASYVSGTTAKAFVDTIIGTSIAASYALTYRLNQVDDDVYNTNAVDGSTITGVTINDGTGRYEINKPGGTIPLQDMYAAAMYYRFTETGIAGGTLSWTATDPVNYSLAGKQIKNVSSPSVPLKITGGWIADGDTDDPLDLLDTSGGTVFLAPPHVVPFASGGSLIDENDIAQAVWDRSLTGHTTIGSAGKTLSDTETNTDVTVAIVGGP